MPLSERTKDRLRASLGHPDAAAEVAAAIASGGAPAANVAAFSGTSNLTTSNVAAIGATANLVGVDGTGSNAAPLAGTESRLDVIEAKVDAVITALNLAAIASGAETRLDNIETKVNAILTSLVNASMMDAP